MLEVLKTGRKRIGHRTWVGDKEVVSNIVPIRKDNVVIGAISVFKDISDVIKLSKELEEARYRIEHLNERLKASGSDVPFVVGSNSVMKGAVDLAAKAAKTSSTILIEGESGTGKEIIARFIHQTSTRRDKPFMAVNCAAIPANLLESELFGYEEGAFTGALKGGRPGLFELASNGTLFLDEIGEMEHVLQAKLLRVLQDTTIRRIGGGKDIPVNVRIISASNQDLLSLVKQHKLREDLYYRLDMGLTKMCIKIIQKTIIRRNNLMMCINYIQTHSISV